MPDQTKTEPKKKLSRRHFASLSLGLLALPTLHSNGTEQDTGVVLFNNSKRKKEKKMELKPYNLPGNRFFPESIGYQPATQQFFVGSLETGEVVRGNLKTGEVVQFLAPGANEMTSAAGVKLGHKDQLYIAGGYSGKIFIYQATTAKLLKSFQVRASQTVVNDFVNLDQAETYVTDSLNPYLYKIWSDSSGQFHFDEEWLPLNGTPIQYQNGLNLNGITATPDKRYLIVGQTNTGQLFRIELATKKVQEIELGGQNLLHADGILLDKDKLYVAQNAFNLITTVQFSHDYLRAKIVAKTGSPAFRFPTAVAKAGEQLLVVNGQLDQEGPGQTPVLPFTVVALKLPLEREEAEAE